MSIVNFLKSKTFLIQLVILLIVSILIIYGLLIWLDANTKHGEEVEVPDLKTLSIEEAQKKLEVNELTYEILDTLPYNPDFIKYGILSQEPPANSKVKVGRKIYLKINAAEYQIVKVPDLVEKTLRQVEPTLLALGLKVGIITYKPYLAKDMVLEMKHNGKLLKAGDKLPKTSAIDLTLGDGSVSFESTEFENTEN